MSFSVLFIAIVYIDFSHPLSKLVFQPTLVLLANGL